MIVQKIAMLLAFVLVLLLLNLKAGSGWFKRLTFYLMLAFLAGAGYLAVDWVVFS